MTILNTRSLLIAAAILLGFSTATQAREITGSVEFNAVGEIIDEVGGNAAAYNSLDDTAGRGNETTCPFAGSPTFGNCDTNYVTSTGDITNMLTVAPYMIMPDDFSFTTGVLEAHTQGTVAYKAVPGGPEAIEWILGPVTDNINGATGELEFIITSGGAADVSNNGSLDDLAGVGFFRFVEDVGSIASTFVDGFAGGTVSQGYWTLSDAGGIAISGFTVPTPAALGLFGLGLLGLGMIRRRREAA